MRRKQHPIDARTREYIREKMFGTSAKIGSEAWKRWMRNRIAELRANGEEINIPIDTAKRLGLDVDQKLR